jgi:hypothetical protein
MVSVNARYYVLPEMQFTGHKDIGMDWSFNFDRRKIRLLVGSLSSHKPLGFDCGTFSIFRNSG